MNSTDPVITDSKTISRFVAEALSVVGVDPQVSAEVGEHLAHANLIGHDSHGVQQLPGYLRSVDMGRIRPNPQIRMLDDQRRAVARLDADGGPGQWAGRIAMQAAIDRASQYGIGVCGVSNSNHFGMAGHFCRLAASHSMVSYATSDTNVVDLAPYGSLTPTVGNNPVAWGLPRPNGAPPVILDMACGAVSGGKVKHYSYSGQSLPSGWALDASGHATTDPDSVLVTASGGYKGSGMALISDLLCGPMLGTAASMFKHKPTTDAANGTGHLFIAIDPEAFGPLDEFTSRVDEAVEAFRCAEPVDPAVPVMYPGELEAATENDRRSNGIALPRSMMEALAQAAGVDLVKSCFVNW